MRPGGGGTSDRQTHRQTDTTRFCRGSQARAVRVGSLLFTNFFLLTEDGSPWAGGMSWVVVVSVFTHAGRGDGKTGLGFLALLEVAFKPAGGDVHLVVFLRTLLRISSCSIDVRRSIEDLMSRGEFWPDGEVCRRPGYERRPTSARSAGVAAWRPRVQVVFDQDWAVICLAQSPSETRLHAIDLL